MSWLLSGIGNYIYDLLPNWLKPNPEVVLEGEPEGEPEREPDRESDYETADEGDASVSKEINPVGDPDGENDFESANEEEKIIFEE